jgi:methyltransferase (TIGR00027 family)
MTWLAARAPESVLPIVIRTRFFDDWLRSVAIDGRLRQVVLLGAGMDTRAWRLPWAPGTRVFEVDRPGPLNGKTAELARAGATLACERRPVDADLATGWGERIVRAGFDPTAPTAWLAEGILF